MIEWAQGTPRGPARSEVSSGDPLASVRPAASVRRAPPAPLEAFVLGKHPAVGDVLRASLLKGVNRLLAEDPGVRHSRDPEAVHQARVATRRLRSDLRTYRKVLSADWTDALRRELGWLGDLLGEVRDLDVLREHVAWLESGLPDEDGAAAATLLVQIERRREAARAHLLGAMQEARYAMLLERIVAAASAPETARRARRPAAEVLPSLMRRPWNSLHASMSSLGAASSDAELHAARISAKRARYAAESMRPVFGDEARAFAETAADLQGVLGDYRDAVVAEHWLRTASDTGIDTSVSFAAGSLAALAREEAARHRARWPRTWKKLSRKRLRFWT